MTDGAQDRNGSCGRVAHEYSHDAGCKLPGLNEMTLSHRFGHLRTPAQGVLHQPADEIYLEIRANRGAAVSGVSCRTLHGLCPPSPLFHVFLCRLTDRCARLNQINRLRNMQHRFRRILRKGLAEDHSLANRRFREAMGEVTGNRSLQPANKRLLISHARIGMTLSRPRNPDKLGTPAKACEQQDGLVEKVEGGDEKGATAQVVAQCRAIRGTPEKHVIPKELRDSHDIGAPSDPDEAINPGEYRAL